MFTIDRASPTPLTDQVGDGLVRLIADSGLAEGQRMPSVRKLAAALGVSAFTVAASYERLAARGIVVARAGAGYFVARSAQPVPGHEAAPPPARPTNAVSFVRNVVDPGSHTIAPGAGFFPVAWMEDALPPAVVGRLLRGAATFVNPAPAQGLLELRRQLSINLAAAAIAAPPAQIVTTCGVTHAVQLICRQIVHAGDSVLVEDPSNMVQHAQVRERGARLLPVPRLPDGPDLDVLERLVREHRPRLFFTQTILHNPTGGATTPANGFRLLSLAEKHDFLIVEDDIFGDLADASALRLASLDALRRVIYVSSFSKLLSPALRVGFIACPPQFVEPLVERKILDVLCGSAVEESLVTNVLQTGRYRAHVDSLRRRLLKARPIALAALLDAGIEFESPAMDGLFLWGAVPAHVSVDRLLSEAFAQGVLLTKGTMFSPSGGFGRHFRFNVACSSDPRVIELLRSVCRAFC